MTLLRGRPRRRIMQFAFQVVVGGCGDLEYIRYSAVKLAEHALLCLSGLRLLGPLNVGATRTRRPLERLPHHLSECATTYSFPQVKRLRGYFQAALQMIFLSNLTSVLRSISVNGSKCS
jgi:hypothetical protein